MARNRKRAKERRNRRTASGRISRPGVATAQGERAPSDVAPVRPDVAPVRPDVAPVPPETELPGPLEQAAPDVELADAQLALGRPDLPTGTDAESESESESEPDDFLDEQEFRTEEDVADSGGGDGGRSGGGLAGGGADGDGGEAGGGELAAPASAAPAPHRNPGARLVNFLKGSWRELQRVQWPDRRQVVQATGVVIGFVIVAGVYLGIADTLATKLMNFVLK